MKIFWFITYNIIILPLLVFGVFIISLYEKKMRIGIRGRLKTFYNVKNYIKNNDKDIYWFHVSSLGEFYQLVPVMEGLKKDSTLLNFVSFSSPSGYENAENKSLDFKFYLPFDFFWSISKIIKIIKPKKMIFVAYDLWPNLVWISKFYNIHTSIFSLSFKKKSHQLKPIVKSFYRTLYEDFNSIYTVSGKDIKSINKIIKKSKNITIRKLGNPRYDMVYNFAKIFKTKSSEDILTRQKRIILGSTHLEDDAMIISSLCKLIEKYPELKIFHVPHNPNNDTIKNINVAYKAAGYNPIILTTIDCFNLPRDQIIILNAVGHLSKLYWFGQLAFIGGGMTTGIHNLMEPAVAGLPTIFGPRYSHAPEAEKLIISKGGYCVRNKTEFEKTITKLFDSPEKLENASRAAKNTIYDNLGSSSSIIRGIIHD